MKPIQLVFFTFGILSMLPGILGCSEPPEFVKVYISHRAQDVAEPFRYVTLYFKATSACSHFHVRHRERNFTKILPIAPKRQSHLFKTYLNGITNKRITVAIRSVNATNNVSSDWSIELGIYTDVLNPEPSLLVTTYQTNRASKEFNYNPMGFYLQPDLLIVNMLPPRIAKSNWPVFFDYECCDSSGVQVVPASKETLNFPKIFGQGSSKESPISGPVLAFSMDWVSMRHYRAVRCNETRRDDFKNSSEVCIVQADDAATGELGNVIQHSPAMVYEIFFNPLKSLLVWSQDKLKSGGHRSFQVKMKHQHEAAVDLHDLCPCARVLAVTSPSITWDWRSHYMRVGEPGVLILSHNNLWRIDSLSKDNCSCINLHKFPQNFLMPTRIASDWQNFYWFSSTGNLFALNWDNKTIKKLVNKSDNAITYFRPVGGEMRPFAPRECYFPQTGNVSIVQCLADTAIVRVSLVWNDAIKCQKIPKSPVNYQLSYHKEEQPEKTFTQEKFLTRDYDAKLLLTDLEAGSVYIVEVNVSVSMIHIYAKGNFYPYGNVQPLTLKAWLKTENVYK